MERMTLGEINKAVSGKLRPREARNIPCKSISTDTRTLTPGNVFLALKGENFNGHNFVEEAANKKAVGAIVEEKLEGIELPLIVVDNTLNALGDLAKYYRQQFDSTIIGITGSVGKTTTRTLVYSVLNKKFNSIQSKKNYNNLIGLPLTLLDIESDTDMAIVELGINQMDEMSRLLEISEPEFGILTSIGPCHLEGLGSIQTILQEKSRLIKQSELGFLNYDNAYIQQIRVENNQIITFGMENPEVDFYAHNIEFDARGNPSFQINNSPTITMQVPGRGAIYAALAAYAVGSEFNVKEEKIIASLADFHPPKLRMEVVEKNAMTIIKDCYNANPISMKEAIKTLCALKPSPKIAILGDMLELGDNEDEFHEELGEFVADSCIDHLFTYGHISQYIAKGARNNGLPDNKVIHLEEKEQLKEHVDSFSKGGAVLIKGSRAMKMEDLVDFL